MSITTPLFQHHKHCDEIFADAEEACGKGDWTAGAAAFELLRGQLETHFGSEEDLCYNFRIFFRTSHFQEYRFCKIKKVVVCIHLINLMNSTIIVIFYSFAYIKLHKSINEDL